jgi:transposase InsO family protein
VRELRQLRDECLNVNEFFALDGVKEILKAWRHAYTHCRPHGTLGNLTPRPRTLVLSSSKMDQRRSCRGTASWRTIAL